MTTIDLNKTPPAGDADQPERPSSPAPTSTAKPLVPMWLRDRETLAAGVRATSRQTGRALAGLLLGLPVLLARLLGWCPRGFGRLVRDLSTWIYDQDSAGRRQAAPDNAEYERVHRVRRANLHARWLVAGSVCLVVLAPVLAWLAPAALAWLVGVAAGAWLIKLILGRSIYAVAAGTGLAIFIGSQGPAWLALVPHPPAWVAWWLASLAVLALGWYGRPKDRAVLDSTMLHGAAGPIRPTAPMIVEALFRIGVPGMTAAAADKGMRDEVRVRAPGVARSRHGYQIELELPPGITAGDVGEKREELAGALRRPLGCVWPSGGGDHPGHLRIYIGDKPMASAPQTPWPLASGQPIDIFEPFPLFTDEEGRWVDVTLMGTHAVVAGASGFGKSVTLRQLACACALDPRVRLYVFDGKISGDLDPVRKVAHAYYEGAEPEDVAEQLAALKGIEQEMRRRARFLRDLPSDERSPKVTSVLASQYPHLAPIVILVDECQEYTEYGVKSSKLDKAIRDEFITVLTRISRLGRSGGVAKVLVSQKPEASVIPTSIMGNCSIRICHKVTEQNHNDQVLGTSAYKNGYNAALFTQSDRGLAWLRAEGDPRVVRSWSAMVDLGPAVELVNKAHALRKARGLLTGQAADEQDEQPQILDVDLLDDVREVMDAERGRNMSLTEILDALRLLRPTLYGPWDVAVLGSALRGAGVKVDAVHVRDQGTAKGVRWDWLIAAFDPLTDEPDDAA